MGRMSNCIDVYPSREVDAYPREYSYNMDDALFKKVKHEDYLLNHHIREISVNLPKVAPASVPLLCML